MDSAFLPGGILERAPVKAVKDATAATIKKEDVDVIVSSTSKPQDARSRSTPQVNEFELSRAQAEKVLAQHHGDLLATLKALITP